jgi:hypothetical protein
MSNVGKYYSRHDSLLKACCVLAHFRSLDFEFCVINVLLIIWEWSQLALFELHPNCNVKLIAFLDKNAIWVSLEPVLKNELVIVILNISVGLLNILFLLVYYPVDKIGNLILVANVKSLPLKVHWRVYANSVNSDAPLLRLENNGVPSILLDEPARARPSLPLLFSNGHKPGVVSQPLTDWWDPLCFFFILFSDNFLFPLAVLTHIYLDLFDLNSCIFQQIIGLIDSLLYLSNIITARCSILR